jgi:glycosyltransferase involved in cell wall biosynthesis
MKHRVVFLSVVPSPYQRDIFAALARRDDMDLRVDYLESAAPDSPWPEKELPQFSRVLRGFWFSAGSARCHVNFPLPDYRDRDIVVLNTMMSVTAQCLMRGPLRHKPWIFWGERLAPRPPSRKDALHNLLTNPLHDAAAIVGIGSLADAQYSARFPQPAHYCIPYHCELDAFANAPRPARDPAEMVFLFCGQMIARKGLDHLLAAFATLVARHPSVRLLLVGREAELPQLLAPLPEAARARIEYAGFQPPEALPAHFARADVFILPSRYDGWGVVVNQAIGAGLPVICSDAVGAGHDLLLPTGDVPALTAAMGRLAAEPALARQWGAASRAKAAAWSPASGAEKWVTVFNEVSGR